MTTSARLGEYKTTAGAISATETVQRKELALDVVEVVTPVIGAAGQVDIVIYTIKTPGKIQSILSFFYTTTAGALQWTGGNQAVQPLVRIVNNGKSVAIFSPAGGVNINAGVCSLILAVGF